MASPLVQKLTGVRDLKRILETTVRELGDTFQADACQVMLSNPLDPNVTSICEFRAAPEATDIGDTCVTVPLVLQGRTFGSVSVSRDQQLSPDELNALRVLLGELGDIIRLAQINDIVQRDTFRETFLVEIGNVMAYSMGIGDALFLVVNILGKALQASRCLFICTDDNQAGWKCYEFWQQDKVKSCQEFYWPATDSPLIAQVLLSRTPLKVFEGQENSYVSPVQEELQFVGVKSLLGVALRSEKGTHGCVILQQCDYRRAWTRSETDMVQNVADKVAEALLKLPAEKLAREPIMQLHQRIVLAPTAEQSLSDVQLRHALKNALGQQAIPSARKSSAPVAAKPAAPAPTPAPAPAPAPAPQEQSGAWVAPQLKSTPEVATPPPPSPSLEADFGPQEVTRRLPAAPVENFAPAEPSPTIKPITRTGRTQDSLPSIPRPPELQGFVPQSGPPPRLSVEIDLKGAPAPADDPYAGLDFGEVGGEPVGASDAPLPAVPTEGGFTGAAPDGSPIGTFAPAPVAPTAQVAPAEPTESVTSPTEPVVPPPTPAPAEAGDKNWGDLDSIPTPAEPSDKNWGNLDSIPTPKGNAYPPPAWAGALDSIPTPASAPSSGGGLRGSMLGKAKATNAPSPLMSSFRKGRGQTDAPAPPAGTAPATIAESPPPLDDESAKKKIEQIMSSSANETSDYIFQTPGLDARLLGRIDGWVTQIEQKDRYKGGHAMQVAQYAVAIAEELGMKGADLNTVRQAALVHDLGKLGIAQQVLQKSDDSLEDEQFVLKMGHAVAGAQLLESFPDLKHLAPIVIAHHEEYDGEGFPQGLKGDEIPVAARILSVANSYHELVANKVYAQGINPEEAQQQMVAGAGSQYDPTLVEALIQAIKSGKVPPSC
ncbi:MAG: HD domain-containing protein [Candidatus Obscuribacterales bacterium]|nr:HD domain-containing protein [Candidatus Obscuribacterales bacterium]